MRRSPIGPLDAIAALTRAVAWLRASSVPRICSRANAREYAGLHARTGRAPAGSDRAAARRRRRLSASAPGAPCRSDHRPPQSRQLSRARHAVSGSGSDSRRPRRPGTVRRRSRGANCAPSARPRLCPVADARSGECVHEHRGGARRGRRRPRPSCGPCGRARASGGAVRGAHDRPPGGMARLERVIVRRTELFGPDDVGVLKARAAVARVAIDAGERRGGASDAREAREQSVEANRVAEAPDATRCAQCFRRSGCKATLFSAGYRDPRLSPRPRGATSSRAIQVAEAATRAKSRRRDRRVAGHRGAPDVSSRCARRRCSRTYAEVDAEIALLAPADPVALRARRGAQADAACGSIDALARDDGAAHSGRRRQLLVDVEARAEATPWLSCGVRRPARSSPGGVLGVRGAPRSSPASLLLDAPFR